MSITTVQYANVYRTLPVDITYFDNGEEKATTLNIKYRPIKRQWLDEWAETAKRFSADLTRQTEDSIGSAFNAVSEVFKAATNGHAPQSLQEKAIFLASVLSLINERMELTDEQKEEQKRLVAEQLSMVLIDVDMVDPETKEKVKPTPEFLYTLDLEFLNTVGEGILKKTAPALTR